jgi:preprotein translocase subunit SecY
MEMRPPVLATWLLKHVARGNDALVGDLLEEHRRRCSAAWYWKQVLMALVLNLSREALLVMGIVAIFLIGSRFSVPGAHADTLTLLARRAAGTPLGPFSILTGGQLLGVTVFTLGIMPYVSAALLVQAFALIWRFLNRNARRRRDVPVVGATWCLAILLCAAQAIGLALFLERSSAINGGLRIVAGPGWTFRITTLLTLTAGTISLMFISDQISKRQIGNGMFLVFVAGIVAGLSGTLMPLLTGQVDLFAVVTYTVVHVAVVRRFALVSSRNCSCTTWLKTINGPTTAISRPTVGNDQRRSGFRSSAAPVEIPLATTRE